LAPPSLAQKEQLICSTKCTHPIKAKLPSITGAVANRPADSKVTANPCSRWTVSHANSGSVGDVSLASGIVTDNFVSGSTPY
jgi:hypothetical protein